MLCYNAKTEQTYELTQAELDREYSAKGFAPVVVEEPAKETKAKGAKNEINV